VTACWHETPAAQTTSTSGRRPRTRSLTCSIRWRSALSQAHLIQVAAVISAAIGVHLWQNPFKSQMSARHRVSSAAAGCTCKWPWQAHIRYPTSFAQSFLYLGSHVVVVNTCQLSTAQVATLDIVTDKCCSIQRLAHMHAGTLATRAWPSALPRGHHVRFPSAARYTVSPTSRCARRGVGFQPPHQQAAFLQIISWQAQL
jgi:hypothetical protein